MRKGSTLGSLGGFPKGNKSLMLPPAVLAVAVLVMASPAAVLAAPGVTPEVKAALQRRQAWLKGRPDAMPKVKPVKVVYTHATWYGPGFHGRRTASGERFDQNAMTLASRHLPFGTRVRVVNPKTGKSAIARVNDRGPFSARHITADLSKGLARKIGVTGTMKVRLEILPK